MHKLGLPEFEEALDRLGVNLEHWPEPLRASAGDLLETSPAAQQLLVAAQALEAALRKAPPITAPPGLADRIVARALEESPPKGKTRR